MTPRGLGRTESSLDLGQGLCGAVKTQKMGPRVPERQRTDRAEAKRAGPKSISQGWRPAYEEKGGESH